eukprot:2089447-Prymnesium_polylepis.1
MDELIDEMLREKCARAPTPAHPPRAAHACEGLLGVPAAPAPEACAVRPRRPLLLTCLFSPPRVPPLAPR